MESGIYAIRNKVNGKIYVGSAKHIQKRWLLHKHHLNNDKHHSTKLQRSWNKHGKEVFEFGIIEICAPIYLIEREQYWLDYFNVVEEGYNHHPLARSALGTKRSEECKRRMSEYRKGRPSFRKGKEIWNEEQRARLAEIAKRENLPLDRRKKMREAKLAENNPCHDKRWIHNSDGKHKRVKRDDIKYYTDQGWIEGRLIKRDRNGNFYDGINEIDPCKRDTITGRFLKKGE